MFDFKFNLQLFAAGTLVNATTQYVNADTGAGTAFTQNHELSKSMKTYYDTELLENSRSQLFFAQFGRKQGLPANHGRTIEWRKWDTLPNASQLTEGVIPSGQKLGMTSITGHLEQYGMFVAITDLLDLHAVDNVLLGASEELGASAGETKDILIRNVLQQGTNVMYADKADGTTPGTYAEMTKASCRLTDTMVNKAATWLKKCKAPTINGKYVAIIHPSVAYDLRSCDGWIEAHKYAAVTEIFNGEIGELHGVRFIETTNAKITQRTVSEGNTMVYSCIFLGKDAYGIVDPEGGAMEMIVKDKSQAGGPLEQYSTAGYKMEDCTVILYPERMVRVECCSAYSDDDSAN